jgi:hypothetical protein
MPVHGTSAEFPPKNLVRMFSSLFRNDLRVIKVLALIQDAFRRLEDQGIHCDPGTIYYRSEWPAIEEEADGKPYTFYTGQSEEISHEELQSLYLVYSVENEQGKDDDLLKAANLIVSELQNAGLQASWSGDLSASIEVPLRNLEVTPETNSTGGDSVLSSIYIHKDCLLKYPNLFSEEGRGIATNSCEDEELDETKDLVEFFLSNKPGESVIEVLRRELPELDFADIRYYQRCFFDKEEDILPVEGLVEWDNELLEELLPDSEDCSTNRFQPLISV